MRAEFRQPDDVTQTRNSDIFASKKLSWEIQRAVSERIWFSTHTEGNFKTQTGTPTTGAQDVVVRESEGTGETVILI